MCISCQVTCSKTYILHSVWLLLQLLNKKETDSFAPICTKVGVFTNPMSRFQGFSPFDKNAIGSSDPCPYHYCSGCGQAQSTGASNDEHSDGVEEGILYSVTEYVSIAGEVAGSGGVGGGVGCRAVCP